MSDRERVGTPPHSEGSPLRDYFRMFTARAITSPMITSELVAWTAMASFAHRASGMTSVGLNAVEFVNPRYR